MCVDSAMELLIKALLHIGCTTLKYWLGIKNRRVISSVEYEDLFAIFVLVLG